MKITKILFLGLLIFSVISIPVLGQVSQVNLSVNDNIKLKEYRLLPLTPAVSFKIVDPYRSDLVYNVYENGEYAGDLNITEAYFFNVTNDSVIILTPAQNYFDVTDVNGVRNFVAGILGFVMFAVFIGMAFGIGRGR